jgi:nucleoside-diphosphate-sugar epimerase
MVGAMRAFVTGGTGFVGSKTIEALRRRGDEVVALVRSPSTAEALADLGVALIEGDLSMTDAMRGAMVGCDAVLHIAGTYRLGIPASERPAMFDANVRGTETTLDAALAAGVPRIVHVSTVNVFGNTKGAVVDETYERDPADGYLSYYDETKVLAHRAAQARIAAGGPIVIVQPGGVYGPGDHSEVGSTIEQVRTGTLRARTFPGLGLSFVYVDDVADGILLAVDQGRLGQSYVLGGQITTLGEVIDLTAAITGREAPRITIPSIMVRASVPLAQLVTRAMGLPPNLWELISSADGVTYWASDAKARRELGYSPRDLRTGLRQTVGL